MSIGCAFAAPRDYFPLQVGNQWTLESRNGQILNIEVLRSRVVNNDTFYLVSGYAPSDTWIRQNDDGELFLLQATEEKIAHLKPGAAPYNTRLSGCEQRAEPVAEPPSTGNQNTLTLSIIYSAESCRDIGLTQEIYTPTIGLTERTVTTFAGPIQYHLVYARVNGKVTSPNGTLVLHTEFRNGSKGWLAGFTDYGLSIGDLRMVAENRPVPQELGGERGAFYIQSMNRSDDLFMFLKKQADASSGLRPNQSYKVSFDIRVASDAPTGCAGVGGAPGESVYLKAGASADEPLAVLATDRHVRLSVDKGEQANGGKDAGVVGNIANGRACDNGAAPYVLLRKTYTHPTTVRTDDRGWLWLLVGTDSGYEGLTGLYYDSITVRLEPVADTQPPAQQ